jgi:uncharacterized protein YjbI with pentapeptide repeats
LSRPPDPKEPVEGKQPGLHTVSKDKLKALLEKHRTWLHSDGGNGGQRADLQQTNLQGVDLQGADLRRALFQGSNLEGANLRAVRLQGAQLASANLARADLSGAELSGADLSNTDLEDVKGLSANQLAGATLTNAKLPEAIRQFESLKTITEASKLARPILLLILSAAVFVFLTAVLTDDKALILNTGSQLIPQLKTPIPTAFFYRLAPFVILSLYVYFLLYLHWIWANVSTLPAVFPDGTGLDKRIYPWLLNRLVAISSRGIDEHSLSHYSLSELVSILLAWWVAPITLGILWFRYLIMHDWTWTLMHVAFFSAAVGIGKASHQRTVITLRGELLKAQAVPPDDKSPAWRRAIRAIRGCRSITWTLAATILTLVISLGAIEGSPPSTSWYDPLASDIKNWMNEVSHRVQSRFLDSFAADLSGLVYNDLTEENVENLKKVRLNRADLVDAELAGAELGGMDLKGAIFSMADLEEAKLQGAKLEKADLAGAKLNEADLDYSHLEAANLSSAELKGAHLGGAHLQDAKLNGADLKGAQFFDAHLEGADLTSCEVAGAQFSGAHLQGANLMSCDLTEANLENANLENAILENAELKGSKLSGANLKDVKGLTQGQLNKAFGDANTKLPPGLTIPAQER